MGEEIKSVAELMDGCMQALPKEHLEDLPKLMPQS